MSQSQPTNTVETAVRLCITVFDYDSPAQTAVEEVLGRYNLDPHYDGSAYDTISENIGGTATLRTTSFSYDPGFHLYGEEVEHFSGIVSELEEELLDYGFQTLSKTTHRLTENHTTDIVLVMSKTEPVETA